MKIKINLINFFSKKNIKDYQLFKRFTKDSQNPDRILKISDSIMETNFYENNLIEKFFF